MFELPTLLITGADGQLGYELVAHAREEGFTVVACNHNELDVTDAAAVLACFEQEKPAYVINCAGQILPDTFEQPVDFSVNRRGPEVLAKACHQLDIALIQLSCADVFDGTESSPYSEQHAVAAVSAYGESLIDGERAVRQFLAKHLILRTGWVFSARGHCPVRRLLEKARQQSLVEVADGLQGSPTAAVDVARVVLALIKQFDCGIENWGVYHYVSSEPISWFGFCEAVIAAARQYEDLELDELVLVPHEQFNGYARPANSVLDCRHILRHFGVHQRSWRTGLMQVVRSFYTHSEGVE